MFWPKLEKILGESIPKCIQETLTACGYSNLLSLKNISAESIAQINDHVNVYCRDLIQNFSCSHAEFYKKQHTFQLLPGHRQLIIAMGKAIDQHHKNDESEYETLTKAIEKNSCFSVVMKELMKTALRNKQHVKEKAQYSDIVRYFATYIFILCGRSCYTVLCKNLPLPSITSIC